MSEPSPYEALLTAGSAAAPKPKVRPSASVVLWRRSGHGLEIYWARRAKTMPFMGGWYAFPGGGLSRRDLGVDVAGSVDGASDRSHTPAAPDLDDEALRDLGPDLAPGIVPCALRELFEETGILPGAPEVDLGDLRRRMLGKEITLGEAASELGFVPDASGLIFAGRWLTPPFVPARFDNRFFLLEWSEDRSTQPTLVGGEHDHAEWITPQNAIERWRNGEVLTAPPILHVARVLADDGAEELPTRTLTGLRSTEAADLGPMRRIEFRPGVILLPLRTPTLPPATHTNAFLLGTAETVLVDPASPLPEEQNRLLAALDAAQRQGRRLTAIWLTHHHPDHVAAVGAVRERFGVPVCAHPETARLLAVRGPTVDESLEDGQRIVLQGPDGGPPFPVQVFHTPGHAPGHLCFFDETHRTLVAGDLVSTLSTIVIDPPEGNMDHYLRSLDRMAALGPRVMFPSHGPGTLEPEAKLREFIRHRLERESQVLAAFRAGKTTPRQMVADVYPEVPPFVHPVAERQIQAHLDRLRGLGEI
ncbi:MAG: MBL fold metallo-hydrolase [Acidobacteriota bacterium]